VNAPVKKPSSFRRKAGLFVVMLAGILVVLFIWLPSPLCCSCGTAHPSSLSTLKNLWNGGKPGSCVAHALGEIDGAFYTDSRDAFILNYERGFRTFEVDLVLLKDGSAFCAHDGSEWMYGLDKPFAETTADELSGRLCLGKYTPLTGSDLLDLMYEYEEACFLLDTKRTAEDSNHVILDSLVTEAKEMHPSVLDRMIPHTFGPADQWEVGKIHHFRDYWSAVYSFRCNVGAGSRAEPDRIVLYVISRGGPLSLLRTADVMSDPSRPSARRVAAAFTLGWPSSYLLTSLCDTRVYISVDKMECGATAGLP
jgi:hypothetical protein